MLWLCVVALFWLVALVQLSAAKVGKKESDPWFQSFQHHFKNWNRKQSYQVAQINRYNVCKHIVVSLQTDGNKKLGLSGHYIYQGQFNSFPSYKCGYVWLYHTRSGWAFSTERGSDNVLMFNTGAGRSPDVVSSAPWDIISRSQTSSLSFKKADVFFSCMMSKAAPPDALPCVPTLQNVRNDAIDICARMHESTLPPSHRFILVKISDLKA